MIDFDIVRTENGIDIRTSGGGSVSLNGQLIITAQDIDDELSNTSENLVKNKVITKELEKLSQGWQLLWTNDKPNQSFAPTILEFDLSEFTDVMILFKFQTTSSGIRKPIIMPIGINPLEKDPWITETDYDVKLIGRYIYPTPTGIIFGKGTNGNSDDNSKFIPVAVYVR